MTSKIANALRNAEVRTPKGFKKVLSVNIGYGTDLHGQSPTAAAVSAVQDAASRTSLPGILNFIPGGVDGMKVKVKIAVPNASKVDKEKVKSVLFSDKAEVKVVSGGMRWQSGLIIPQLGDPNPKDVGTEEAYSSDDEAEIDAHKPYVSAPDDFLSAVAAIRVGY